MALENPSYVAGEDIGPSLIVKQSAAADHTMLKCTSGDKPIGVIYEGTREAPIPGITPLAAASGESARVYGPGETCEVIAGAAITRGDLVMSDDDSKAVPATEGNWALGRAEKSVASGERCRVYIEIHNLYATVTTTTTTTTT